MKNYYDILGLEDFASDEDIKIAFRKLSLKFHPDKNNGDIYFSEWSIKINEAYETLGNATKKDSYDVVLKNKKDIEDLNGFSSSNNNIDVGYDVLNSIKKMTPDFLNARHSLIQANSNYNNISSRSIQNKFSTSRVLFIVLLFLISAYGLKKTFNDNDKSKLENLAISKVTAISGLSIRDKPNKNSTELILAPYKAKLKIIQENVLTDYINNKNGFWHKVEYQGLIGFSWGNYLDKD